METKRKALLINCIHNLNQLIPMSRELDNDSTSTIINLKLKFENELADLNRKMDIDLATRQANCPHTEVREYIQSDGNVFECTHCGQILGSLPAGAHVKSVIDR